MPHYFFDIDDGDRRTRDDEGLDLDGPAAARMEAIRALPDVARDVMPDGDHRTILATIRNEAGKAIFRAELSLTAQWLE